MPLVTSTSRVTSVGFWAERAAAKMSAAAKSVSRILATFVRPDRERKLQGVKLRQCDVKQVIDLIDLTLACARTVYAFLERVVVCTPEGKARSAANATRH